MKKENIGEEKREIVSKVNRCNWPDSWIDEKRYTGKMEKADNCRNSRYIQKPNPRGGRSNQCQSIERFILDRFPFSSFPSTVFNLPFPVETFSRRKTSSFILFPCPVRVVEMFPRVAPSQSPSNRPLIRPKTRPNTATGSSSEQKGSRGLVHIIVLANRVNHSSQPGCATLEKSRHSGKHP